MKEFDEVDPQSKRMIHKQIYQMTWHVLQNIGSALGGHEYRIWISLSWRIRHRVLSQIDSFSCIEIAGSVRLHSHSLWSKGSFQHFRSLWGNQIVHNPHQGFSEILIRTIKSINAFLEARRAFSVKNAKLYKNHTKKKVACFSRSCFRGEDSWGYVSWNSSSLQIISSVTSATKTISVHSAFPNHDCTFE